MIRLARHALDPRTSVCHAQTANSHPTVLAYPPAPLAQSALLGHVSLAIQTAQLALAPCSTSAPAVLLTGPSSATDAASRRARNHNSSTLRRPPASRATRVAPVAPGRGQTIVLRAQAPVRSCAEALVFRPAAATRAASSLDSGYASPTSSSQPQARPARPCRA